MIRSKSHLAFIRTLRCLACLGLRHSRIEAAHVRLGGGGGMGLKPPDNCVVPLCAACHREQHTVGEKTFWAAKQIDPLHYAKLLYEATGDRAAADSIFVGRAMRSPASRGVSPAELGLSDEQ